MSSGYSLQISRKAQKFLKKQDKTTQKRLIQSLELLLLKPPQGDIKPMKGSEYFRLRVGSFWILFIIDHEEEVVNIESIGNRGDIYK